MRWLRVSLVILVLDNRDSFVFNLDQILRGLGQETEVLRSDRHSAGELLSRSWKAVVLSPGPGRPEEAGCLLEILRQSPPELPILGICLGQQALALAEGGSIRQACEIFHGRNSWIRHKGQGIFENMPNPIEACRYHSLIVDRLPDCFDPTAWSTGEEKIIMGIQHRELPRFGLQFHPESFRTPRGAQLVENFLRYCA
jgi:anthranilate synthase component II